MADEPKLNSLDRFRKHPGRLVLEEHGGCEVPAGCGGVILRWRNPLAAVPVTVYLYTPVPATCLVDGTPVETGRLDLAPGQHVLAVAIEDVDWSAGLILFAASHEPKKARRSPPAEVVEYPLRVLSAPDGNWKYSTDVLSGDAWTRKDFDDTAWPALVAASTPPLDRYDTGAFAGLRAAEVGAACLRLPGRAGKGSVRIRKVFEVPAPRLVAPSP
jgi:hypothetical protein